MKKQVGVLPEHNPINYFEFPHDVENIAFTHINDKRLRAQTAQERYGDYIRPGHEPILGFYDASTKTALFATESGKFELPEMAIMLFAGLLFLKKIEGLPRIDTSKCTNMSHMFYGCESVKELDLSYWDTSNVTDMNSMFSECRSLASLDISHFNTSRVTDMSWMFNVCDSLPEIDVQGFDVKNVTDMSDMFYACSSVELLDFSKWDTRNVKNTEDMFYNCRALKKVILPHGLAQKTLIRKVIKEQLGWGEKQRDDRGSRNTASQWNTSLQADARPAVLPAGSLESTLMFRSSGERDVEKLVFTGLSDPRLKGLDMREDSISEGRESVQYFKSPGSFTGYLASESGRFELPQKSSNLFSGLMSLKEIEGLSRIDASKAKNMAYMFDGCESLEKLDLSSWDTGSVTDMSCMFNECRSLTDLNVSKWDTSHVTDMSWMFHLCDSLPELDVSRWDTSKVCNMSNMFDSCASLEHLDIADWNTENVESMRQMFGGCQNLTSLDLMEWKTPNVKDFSCMFDSCISLSELHVEALDASSAANMSYMFNSCVSLKELIFSYATCKNIPFAAHMLEGCENLKFVGLPEDRAMSFVIRNAVREKDKNDQRQADAPAQKSSSRSWR